MYGYHPAAVAALFAKQLADTPDRVRHAAPASRPPWWTRVASRRAVHRSSLVLLATVATVLVASGPALAAPAPLIEPEPGSGSAGAASGSGHFYDSWVQVGLAVLIAAVVVVVVASIVSRVRHHQPSAA
jgi:hypothetical protein